MCLKVCRSSVFLSILSTQVERNNKPTMATMVATLGIPMVTHVEKGTGRYRFLMKSVFVPHSAR